MLRYSWRMQWKGFSYSRAQCSKSWTVGFSNIWRKCTRKLSDWCRIAFSGMLRRVALVRTDLSEELSASFIRVTRIGELGTTLVTASVVPSSPILVTMMKEALSSFYTSVLTRATRYNISEYAILHSHRRENLKSYKLSDWWLKVCFHVKYSQRYSHDVKCYDMCHRGNSHEI
jgi:hypothetical protein